MYKRYLILFFSILAISTVSIQSFAEDGHDHGDGAHSETAEPKHDEDKGHDGHDHSDEVAHGTKEQKGEAEDDGHGHEEEGEHHEENVMELDQEAREMIGLETTKAQKKTFGDRLKVYGKIAKDTEQYSHITYAKGGVVEKVHVALGDIVDAGSDLLTIKQPDGVTEQIKSAEHGTIISIYVKPGDKVDRLKSLVSIVNLDILRATIDIYEKDLRFVKIGQKVEVMSIAYPAKIFHGKVVFISPEIDDESKSIKIRVDVDNSEHLLKLGMSISGELIYHTDRESLIVPKSAIQLVNGENVVFVPGEGDEIEIGEVALGHAVGDAVEVMSGLSDGEQVVVHGSFYLKSEREKEAFGDGHAH